MKVLLDSCMWGNAKSVIAAGGHEVEPACVAALARYGEELQAGALVTVEQARIRIRPADRRSG